MSAIRKEAGLPILDEAGRLVIEGIKQARRAGTRVQKMIHGYGSSGRGRALYVGLRKREGAIKDAIVGEGFAIFHESVLDLLP
jgi:predicted phage tail protein